MAWNVSVDAQVAKQLEKLDKVSHDRIIKFFRQLQMLDNPRIKGEPLMELRFKGLWRYRVGDYRLICNIKNNELIVLVLDVGHRSKIYR